MTVHLDKNNGYQTSGRPEAIVRNASTALLESLAATRGTALELASAISDELDARFGMKYAIEWHRVRAYAAPPCSTLI